MSKDIIESYGKIRAAGHRENRGIFEHPCIIQEKVDGSQFSFRLGANGELVCRSRNNYLNVDDPPNLFAPTIAHLLTVTHKMEEGYLYYGEAMKGPKHNILAYANEPLGNLVLWDVFAPDGHQVEPMQLEKTAVALGVDAAPHLASLGAGEGLPREFLDDLLDTDSFLGGQKLEGIVVKAWDVRDEEGKPLNCKFVSSRFKEVANHKKGTPKMGALWHIESMFITPQRLDKALQHLREDGKLTDSFEDIRGIVQEFQRDLMQECEEAMKEEAWKHLRKDVLKKAGGYAATSYKSRLLTDVLGEVTK